MISSFWNGSRQDKNVWKDGETIEIILNLEIGVVTYYKITESLDLIRLKRDLIASDETYYFALSVSADHRCGVFESVMPVTMSEV